MINNELETNKDKIFVTYAQGKSLKEIAKIYKVDIKKLRKLFRNNNIAIKKSAEFLRHNIINKKYNLLRVLEFHSPGNDKKQSKCKWKCLCDCGKITIVSGNCLKSGKTRSCGCLAKLGAVKRRGPKVGLIPWWFFKHILYGAKIRNIPFNLTQEDLSQKLQHQNFLCALSNEPIQISDSEKNTLTTASLDRINSDKDYTLDNIQWVHKDVNAMKVDYSEDRFIEICNKVCYYKTLDKLQG